MTGLLVIRLAVPSYDWHTGHVIFSEPFGGVIPGARGAVLSVLMRTGAPLTGRQVHTLVKDRYSLWTVQQALQGLERLGLTDTQAVGRAGVHTINEQHAAIAPLRSILSPIDLLADVLRESVRDEVEAVVVFGSVARGQAHANSDIDLAVIAPATWDGRVRLEDDVRSRLGNACDVLHLTRDDLAGPASTRDPVVAKILRDGIALVGAITRPGWVAS